MAFLQRGWGGVLVYAHMLAQECIAENLVDLLVRAKFITRYPQSDLNKTPDSQCGWYKHRKGVCQGTIGGSVEFSR